MPVQVAVERRPTLLFLIVLSFLFFLMSRSTRTRYFGETRTLFERTVMTVFAPVPRVVNWVGERASDMYHGYIDMRRAVDENAELQRKVAQLTQENMKLKQSSGELARMRAILAYSEQFSMPTLLARVVMYDTSSRFRAIVVDRGSDHGVEVNDTVVNPDGLVGRVVLTTKDMSKIQLVTDTTSSVGALIERTRRQGVIRGDGRYGASMLYVPSLADVQVGDQISTAGIDGIFPKGIPVARVVKVSEGSDLFKNVLLQPTVDFGTLEDVMILHTRKIPENVARYAP